MIERVPTPLDSPSHIGLRVKFLAESKLLEVTEDIREKIKEQLLNLNLTQAEVASWLMVEHPEFDIQASVAERIIYSLMQELLTSDQRNERFMHAQQQNAILARKASRNDSENGRKGASIRAAQMKKSGKNPNGDALWKRDEKVLRSILKQENAPKTMKGNIDIHFVYSEFCRRSRTRRTFEAIRAKVKRLLKDLN